MPERNKHESDIGSAMYSRDHLVLCIVAAAFARPLWRLDLRILDSAVSS